MHLRKNYMKRFVFVSLACLFGFGLQPALLWPSDHRNHLRTVTDGTATVPGAVVTVRDLDTNATHNMTTDGDGRFIPWAPGGAL